MGVEPVPDMPAAVVETGDQRLLAVADYHAGIESVLRTEGVELESQADQRRDRLLGLVADTAPDRLVVLGDLVHAIGDPWDAERAEIADLFDSLAVPVTLVKGNHDGQVESILADREEVTITDSDGVRLGSTGFVHGHTWPSDEVLDAEVVCVGHEHPVVRLEDDVGGSRVERVWLRGDIDPTAFAGQYDSPEPTGEMVVFPAFNDLSGGTWVNVRGQEFLAPFLPAGLADGQAYLLDGTRLGAYTDI